MVEVPPAEVVGILDDEVEALAEADGLVRPAALHDLGAAHGVTSWPIAGLSPNEPAERRRTMAVTVFDTISNGTYTVSCTLSRDP